MSIDNLNKEKGFVYKNNKISVPEISKTDLLFKIDTFFSIIYNYIDNKSKRFFYGNKNLWKIILSKRSKN